MRGAEIRNAKITGTSLLVEDHGTLTAFVHLDYGDSGQGFGGHVLDSNGACALFIRRTLATVGVESWESLKGHSCRALQDNSKVHAIGHFLEDRWFNPSEELERLSHE